MLLLGYKSTEMSLGGLDMGQLYLTLLSYHIVIAG